MIRAVAEGLEMSYGWEPTAAQRLGFVIDFAYATGLRASELVGARLGMIEEDARGERWLHLVGKGSKAGSVALRLIAIWRNASCRPRRHGGILRRRSWAAWIRIVPAGLPPRDCGP